MKKDFDRWNEQKSKLNDLDSVFLFKEREIWFCYLGLNIGHEQDGGIQNICPSGDHFEEVFE